MSTATMTVEELKQALKTKFAYDGRELRNKTEAELRQLLDTEEAEVAATKEIDFGDLKEIDDVPMVQNELKEAFSGAPPAPGSEDWHAHIMGLFFPSEVTDGHPNVEGLRRVAQLKIGNIVKNYCYTIQEPNPTNHFSATAACDMIVQTFDGVNLEFQDVADANKANTPAPFNLHLSSTASSRAESRVLRKVLQLNKIISAEEIVPEGAAAQTSEDEIASFEGPQFITDNQMTLIDMLCERLDIDAVKYLNSGSKQYRFITDIPRKTAAEMGEYLHNYEKGKATIPSAIKGYKRDWKGDN